MSKVVGAKRVRKRCHIEGAALSYTSAIKRFGRDTARAIWQVTCDNRALARQYIGEERLDCWYREAGNLKFSLSESELAEDAALQQRLLGLSLGNHG